MSSIFSKIASREIPGYFVYEDNTVFAILDINPMQKGHTLVIPKQEVDKLFHLDDETYTHLMQVAKKLALHMEEKLGCTRVCVVVEGYAVPHAHVHLIPTNHPDDFDKRNVYQASKEELEEVYTLLTA
jgi:histidine triad (HIT) family protein